MQGQYHTTPVRANGKSTHIMTVSKLRVVFSVWKSFNIGTRKLLDSVPNFLLGTQSCVSGANFSKR